MRPEDAPRQDQTIRLSDYAPPPWLVEETRLVFRLAPSATRVTAEIRFRRNPAHEGEAPIRLDGEQLKLISAAIDGAPVDPAVDAEGLTLPDPGGDAFTWECETEIDPRANTALEGLYMSNGMYCTQCEAQGFRKITYYPDRPDVMAPFSVRIEGDLPVLLSNGNLVEEGDGFAEWRDPWPKPAYLFALVAGDLVSHDDSFTTMSGRHVDLKIWVRPGDEDRCAYAMDALKRSMKWDEEAYGREYDLDLFQIVAVEDFNMGAMENKGLNIFNSKYVLASPETATDRDYEFIEGIIAHEYFHNWTGNRITCRDWFQLCLKEGLTVFRDQQFSADMRSPATQRIGNVAQLRARQFREDAGPLAHPVRPEEYIEINNFYTATVYEKGAEVIGMLRRLVGAEGYDKALDLYFERHDGQACTIEDWLKVFEDATGRDLTQFNRWYSQAGTPRVAVAEDYYDGVYSLTLTQETRPTPGQPDKAPQVIPVAYALLDSNGREMTNGGVLELTEREQTWEFNLPERPTPSLFREFSAPVIVDRRTGPAECAFLMANDTDPFNKWEAGRTLALQVALALTRDPAAEIPKAWLDAFAAIAADDSLDDEFRAFMLSLPGQEELAAKLADGGEVVDPDAVFAAIDAMSDAAARRIEPTMRRLYEERTTDAPYAPDAASAGRRSLRNSALGWITQVDGGAMARAQFAAADNMTDSLAALGALVGRMREGAEEALEAFRARWSHDSLVMDKWYVMQATSAAPDTLARVRALADDPAFNWRNPNKFRSLIGAFSANPVNFHAADGSGYRFFADRLIAMDDVTPQTAARTAGAFETWRRYDEDRQALIRAELERIRAKDNLSKDMGEIVGRILGA